MLAGVLNGGLDLSSIMAATSARTPLLQHGARQRVAQTVLGVARAEQSWLSSALQPDVSTAIAVVVGQPPEGEDADWTDEERYSWLICILPEAGDILVTNSLDRLPESNDDLVDQAIGMVFIQLGAADDQTVSYLPLLLRDESLARVRRSPECYGELILRLGGLLANRIDLPPEICEQVESVLIEAPTSDSESVALLTVKHQALVSFLEEGQLASTYIAWLTQLTAAEHVPLESARSVFQLIAAVCTTLPQNVKSAFLRFTTELLAVQRYAMLWEIRRINHECDR